MSFSRKQALDELSAMFPDFDREALDSLLRANSKLVIFYRAHLDNLMDQTIESILAINSQPTPTNDSLK
jgi:predicted NUDIX family NTP pyrophosphohydrolase